MYSVLGSLIGAVIGSIGAVIIGKWMENRKVLIQERKNLVQCYLFQLQDAVEALWNRLDNLAHCYGKAAMDQEYFEASTLYAIGRVLAIERIMMLEAAYPQLEICYPELGQYLKEHRIDYGMRFIGFHQYNRLTLADLLIRKEAQGYRLISYIEFRRGYDPPDSMERKWLEPALQKIHTISQSKKTMENLLELSREIIGKVSEHTKMPGTLQTCLDPVENWVKV